MKTPCYLSTLGIALMVSASLHAADTTSSTAPSGSSAQAAQHPTTKPDAGRYNAGITFENQKRRIAEMNGQCDVIFIGDSITQGWNQEVWDKYFGSRKAFNYGVGGDTTQNVLARLQYDGLKTIKPKVAVILIGTNNTVNTAEDIAEGVQAVVDATKANFPGVKIILLDILPNARKTELMASADQFISQISDQQTVFRLDLSEKMPKEGNNWKGLLPDKLHLTKEGYQIWAENMEPLLSKLLGDTPVK